MFKYFKYLIGVVFVFLAYYAFATPPYYMKINPGSVNEFRINGSLLLYRSTSTAVTDFEVIGGTITKVYAIKFADGTMQTTAGGSGGSIDASQNITWTGIHTYMNEARYKYPNINEAGMWTTSITRYGEGPLVWYTLGERLETDTTNFYMADGMINPLEKKTIYISSPTAGINVNFKVDTPIVLDKVCILAEGGTSVEGKLVKMDKDGASPSDLSIANWTGEDGVEYSTATFNAATIVTGDRIQWQTVTVTGDVGSLTVDIWYKRQ